MAHSFPLRMNLQSITRQTKERERAYCVRNAKKDVCDSRPEIPYWWHKSVLNPDSNADWLTEQICIISSTIIQYCDMQKIYLVLLWKFFDSAFDLFVQYSMYHRSKKANFRLFIVFSAVERFCQFADRSARIRQVASISNGASPHVDSWERWFISPLLAFYAWPSEVAVFFWIQSYFWGSRARSKNVAFSIERGNVTFLYLFPKSELTTKRWRNTLEIYQESLIGCGWSLLCYRMGQSR